MIRLKVCIPLTECNWNKLSTLYNLYNYLQTRLCPPINFWILQTLILHHIFFYSSLNYFCVGFSFSFKDIYIFILMFQGYPKHAFDMNLLLVAVTFALRWSCEPIGGGGCLLLKSHHPELLPRFRTVVWLKSEKETCCLIQKYTLGFCGTSFFVSVCSDFLVSIVGTSAWGI